MRDRLRRSRALRASAALCTAFAFATAVAQVAAQTSLATYAGADRMQRLVEGAKREGEVVIYTSAPADDMKALTDAFERTYGIRTKVWRASSEKVLQRTLAEARNGRFDVDVVETNGPEMEALAREKVLQPVRSPSHADLVPQAVFAHGAWVGSRLNVFVVAYNTNLVRRDELPKDWRGLRDPRWKGRLGIEASDIDWFATVVSTLGDEQEGIALFRDIVKTNGISVRRGHTLLAQLVAAGEVPLALTVYNNKAEQLKQQGAPIDWFVLDPAVARANGVGVVTRPRNAHAALLFYEFEIGEEGQRLLATRDFVPASRRIETMLNRIPFRFVDVRAALDDYAKWEKLYDATFLRQAR